MTEAAAFGIKSELSDEIIRLAKNCGVTRVILFGSRARGDYHRTSDIDLAVLGGDISRFAADIEEKTSTLLKFDVIDLDRPVQPSLRDAIKNEGIVLYEKI